MTRYERIRQEIIAVEKEIAILRHAVSKKNELQSFKSICTRKEQIRDNFSEIRQAI